MGSEAIKELIFENFSFGSLHRLVDKRETWGLTSTKHTSYTTKEGDEDFKMKFLVYYKIFWCFIFFKL